MAEPLDPEHAKEYFDLFGSLPRAPLRANPRVTTPNTDPRLGPNPNPARSTVEQLNQTVDELRQLYTDIGARPYRVFSIVYQWTGGATGKGEPEVLSQLEFLPTPMVTINTRNEAKAGGIMTEGSARLTEVSARYSEADIKALFPLELAPGQQSFIEVRLDARDGERPYLRRFTVVDSPELRPLSFDWRIRLQSQDSERDRFSGGIDTTRFYPQRMRP